MTVDWVFRWDFLLWSFSEELDGLCLYTSSHLVSHFCFWPQNVSQVHSFSSPKLACGYKPFYWLNTPVLSFSSIVSSSSVFLVFLLLLFHPLFPTCLELSLPVPSTSQPGELGSSTAPGEVLCRWSIREVDRQAPALNGIFFLCRCFLFPFAWGWILQQTTRVCKLLLPCTSSVWVHLLVIGKEPASFNIH